MEQWRRWEEGGEHVVEHEVEHGGYGVQGSFTAAPTGWDAWCGGPHRPRIRYAQRPSGACLSRPRVLRIDAFHSSWGLWW